MVDSYKRLDSYLGFNKGDWYVRKDDMFFYQILYVTIDNENNDGIIDGKEYIDVECREYYSNKASTGIRYGIPLEYFKKYYTNERKLKLEKINENNNENI